MCKIVSTISELILKVHEVSDKLVKESNDAISMTAGTAVFLQILNRLSQVDIMDLDKCRRLLIESGDGLVQKANQCREVISNLSSSFIRDNMVR
ncbi:Translation initiation factor eIF-2B subunit alpha [Smittium culicis]|uniref:Translation initiation factor eIF-2B subunit alpha n=1 Tax=Smittium culicis TaxID=133412 RepID=A0A1R1WZB0_9FUNG|nr:Translation initiation factor eIF-2B subunit alpha [Smittium culicis]OMJ24887.1 Translation initiation factor eIF-2B subunit alpha [Smittium culicis]